MLCSWIYYRSNNMNIVNELKDITSRAKIVERLYTLYDLKQILNEKITKAEQELVALDMEVAKDGLNKKKEA
jgi:hypothetical protein